jgi:AcrR family transcriptional regulator
MARRAGLAVEPKGDGQADNSTRERLLTVTGQLIMERGSAEVSLSDIAEKSGMSSALVRYYFGNKSGLMMALLRKAIGPLREELKFLLAGPLSPEQKMRVHLKGFVDGYARFPWVGRLMHHMLAEDPALYGPIIAQEISKPVFETQRTILEDGFKAGCFKHADPLAFFFLVSGACDNLFFGRFQLEYLFGIKDIDEAIRKKFAEDFCALLCNGILAVPGGEAGKPPASRR